jgi:hypothetical protein
MIAAIPGRSIWSRSMGMRENKRGLLESLGDLPVHSRLLIYGTFLCFSIFAVYCNYVFVYTASVTEEWVGEYRSLAIRDHHAILDGTMPPPYRWRLLGNHLINALEHFIPVSPIFIDQALRVAFLFGSCFYLFRFSSLYTSPIAAFCVVQMYIFLVVVGESYGYFIYNLNDIIFFFALHYCVLNLRLQHLYRAIGCIFVATFAREATLVMVFLMGFLCYSKKNLWLPLSLGLFAFLIPYGLVRWLYPAPLSSLAFWWQLFNNVPFLQGDMGKSILAIQFNIKVFLFMNAFWILAVKYLLRREDAFMASLSYAMVLYVLIIYWVGFIRELRLFVPLAVLVLPAGMSELERMFSKHGSRFTNSEG